MYIIEYGRVLQRFAQKYGISVAEIQRYIMTRPLVFVRNIDESIVNTLNLYLT